MSTNLYWLPAPTNPPKPRELPFQLKKALADRFWGHDGSLYGSPVTLGQEYTLYVDGLADAGVEGAADLLAAIRAHGAVQLWIEE